MKLIIITWTILLISSIFSINAHPSKPLNERSTELAWQAWLLVDEHQNKQDSDGVLRRRITPKSIFITPTFSPDKLQPCADGYESDNMGRCMKIIKIDEDAHLDYLLQKLNAQFGIGMIVDVDEKLPTPGPIKFEISLGNGNPETQEQVTEEPNANSGNVAIVVAPTNTNLQSTTQDTSTTTLEAGTSTLSELETITSTRFAESTVTGDFTTTTEVEDDGSTEPQALFFRDPSKNPQGSLNHELTTKTQSSILEELPGKTTLSPQGTSQVNIEGTTFDSTTATLKPHEEKLTVKPQRNTYDDIIVIGNRMREPETTTFDDKTTTSEDVRFDLSQVDSKKPEGVTIKFPYFNKPASTSDFPSTADRVRDFEQLFSSYVNTRAGDLTSNERLIFNRTTEGTPSIGVPSTSYQLSQNARPLLYNHRNRDKHHVTWQFPERAEHYRKRGGGLVEGEGRFNRGHGQGGGSHQAQGHQRTTSAERYYRPGSAEAPAVYREVPRKDLSHIFGFKRAMNNR